MGRFAPVASLKMYQELAEVDALGNYHLLLAHKILEAPADWKEFYLDYRKRYPDCFIIMDNSLVELGEALPADDILIAAKLVDASCIVLPDQLNDKDVTLTRSLKAAQEIKKYNCPPPTLGVAQGRNKGELHSCIDAYVGEVDYVSIPRVAVGYVGSRKNPTMYAAQKFPNAVHLLGFSDDIEDDVASARIKGVMGIDSAVPVRLGMQGIEFDPKNPPDREQAGMREPNYLDIGGANETVVSNVRRMHECLQPSVAA